MSSSRDDFGIAFRSALLQRGAAQKFSLVSLIILAIFIFFLDTFGFAFMKPVRSIINDAIYRVSLVASSSSRFVPQATGSITNLFDIKSENERLKKALEVYRQKELSVEYLSNQNKNIFGLEVKSNWFIDDKSEEPVKLHNQDSKNPETAEQEEEIKEIYLEEEPYKLDSKDIIDDDNNKKNDNGVIEETEVVDDDDETDESEEEIEVEMITHYKKQYYIIKGEKEQYIYAINDGGLGDKVGEIKDGKKIMYKKN